MPNVSIIINQIGKPAGVAGVSRDDIATGSSVVLTNDPTGSSGVTVWKWEFLSWPKSTATELAPTLSGSSTSTCTFIPTDIGTYIVQLTINGRIKGTIGIGIKSINLSLRFPGERETDEYPGGWGYNILDILKTLESSGGGGGGGTDRYLTFSDDTEFEETGNVYVTKKTFRIIVDADNPPKYWRAVISLWVTGGVDTASCQINIGGDIITLNTSSATEYVLSSTSAALTSLEDTLLTATIKIKLSSGAGATAHIKYTDIYAIYDT